MAKSTVEMTPEERKLHGIRCMIGRANGYLRLAKTPAEVAKRTEELKEAIAKYEEATGLPYTGPGIKNRNTFKEDEIVIYKNGSSFEIGRIKSLADDGAFVFYSVGETAAKTPYDKLYKVTNASCVGQTRLGWYADHGES